MGKFLKGLQGQDQGQPRQWPLLLQCKSRPALALNSHAATVCILWCTFIRVILHLKI